MALSKSKLEEILHQDISSFEVCSGSNEGDNVGGSLFAVKVLTNSGSQLHLIYKCQLSSPCALDSHYIVKHRIKSVFSIETAMYEVIFPMMTEALHSIPDVVLPIPKYISGYNDTSGNDYICLEDLRPQGYRMQSKFGSLTAQETILVMKEIAKFHALSYHLIKIHGESFFEQSRTKLLTDNCLTNEEPEVGETFSKMFRSYFQNTAELLSSQDKILAEKIQKFVDSNDWKAIHKIRRFNHERTDKSIFPCVIHGDLWTNNILFKYSHDEYDGDYRKHPISLKFIDFQLSRRSNVYEELGYFLWTSTTPAFRKIHLETCLSQYYTSFSRFLILLNSPHPSGFTLESFLTGFQDGVLCTFAYMPFAISLQMMGPGVVEKNRKNTDLLEEDKEVHKFRIATSPEGLMRLEELSREAVEMNIL